MQILKIDDPRDPLSKASRYELCQLAKAHGITEIGYGKDGQTLPEMVKILHDRGIHTITMPDRPLGIYKPVVLNADDVAPVSSQPAPAVPVVEAPSAIDKPVSEMNMTEMRKECKRRGIKMDRTDNLKTLRDKLSG